VTPEAAFEATHRGPFGAFTCGFLPMARHHVFWKKLLEMQDHRSFVAGRPAFSQNVQNYFKFLLVRISVISYF
jgi:hypothetical protein